MRSSTPSGRTPTSSSATNSLYKSLHHFRQAVRRAGGPRDVIHLDHPLISLAPYVRTDIDDFRERFAAVRASSTAGELAAVLAVGGEPLLPEDIYEPWAEPFRSDIHLQVTRIRMRLANMHLDASAFDDAIEQYRAVLATDDLSEEAHVGLMRAYAASDRRDLALRQYERSKELLDTELGTEPSAETEALAAQIRREGAKSRIDEAIDDEIRAGDAAMRQHAHREAAERYRAALKQLQAADEDDERESALLLQLASATMAIGSYADVAEQCRRAAHLAERAGAFDLLARALVRFQRATDTVPQNYAGHRESMSSSAARSRGYPPARMQAARCSSRQALARWRRAPGRTTSAMSRDASPSPEAPNRRSNSVCAKPSR